MFVAIPCLAFAADDVQLLPMVPSAPMPAGGRRLLLAAQLAAFAAVRACILFSVCILFAAYAVGADTLS